MASQRAAPNQPRTLLAEPCGTHPATLTNVGIAAPPPRSRLGDLSDDCLLQVFRHASPSLRLVLRCVDLRFSVAIAKPRRPALAIPASIFPDGHTGMRCAIFEAAAEVGNLQLAEWALLRAREVVTEEGLRRAATPECFRQLVKISSHLHRLQILSIAANRGDLAMIQELDPESNFILTWHFGTHLIESACQGTFENVSDVLDWLHNRQLATVTHDLLGGPACRGDMKMVQWLVHHGASYSNAPSPARELDRLLVGRTPMGMLRYLWTFVGLRYVWRPDVPENGPMELAAAHHRVDFMVWLLANSRMVSYSTHRLVHNAVESGDVDCLRYVAELCGPEEMEKCWGQMRHTRALLPTRAYPGRNFVDMSRHLIHEYGVHVTAKTFERAVALGEFELAKLLLPRVYPRYTPPASGLIVVMSDDAEEVADYYRSEGQRNLAMLEWLVEQTVPIAEVRLQGGLSWDVWPVLAWADRNHVPIACPWFEKSEECDAWVRDVLDFYTRNNGMVPKLVVAPSGGKLMWAPYS